VKPYFILIFGCLVVALFATFATPNLSKYSNTGIPEFNIEDVTDEYAVDIERNVFDVSAQNLDQIPWEKATDHYYTALDISVNDIKSISPRIVSFVYLKEFYADNAGLEMLPKEIGKLPNLEILETQNNNISSIPKEICQLILLKKADFSNNPVEEVPDCIANLTQLELLDLQGTFISKEEISKMRGELTETVILYE
jgi:Leucine-rich repeat (LRR) protein